MDAAEFALPFEALRRLLLELAREREAPAALGRVVAALCEQPGAALARIWLVRPGDICPDCPLRGECPQRVPCLQLAASAGRPVAEPGADWSRLDGEFRRFPLGRRKIGSVAATTEAVWVEDVRVDSRWIARPEWAAREGVRGFGGQPLVHQGEVLGVLGLFTRRRFGAEALASLRLIADHAAAALAAARAFERIAELQQRLALENACLRDELAEAQRPGELLGTSAALRQLRAQIEQVAPTEASVLILGESGTGKELVAREIHRRSRRAARALIRVNCAAVPASLYESEFFGHVRGAFTGALAERAGRFAAADGGTLLLDEVGEIPLELQPKLLRVLQEGEYERVGEDRTRRADVRVLASTNRNLTREIRAGRFREDLYYRLGVFPIEVPPLRRRPEDIPLLAAHFTERAARRLGRRAVLGDADAAELQRHPWPGNVRELENAVERAVITARGGRLRFELPPGPEATPAPDPEPAAPPRVLTAAELRELERANLRAALERCDGKVYGPGGAAELLRLPATTVASQLKRLGLAVRRRL